MFKRLHLESKSDNISFKKGLNYKQIYSGKTNSHLKTNSYGEKYKNKTLFPRVIAQNGIPQVF
jgi:hypothetical protein